MEAQLGAADSPQAAPGLVLRTGPITLLSTDVDGQPQSGHHSLTAAEAAAHLSAAIKQRRIAARLGGAAAEAAGGGGASGTSQDAAAAVAAVEGFLLYQQFEFSIAELQADANLVLPPEATADAAAAASSGGASHTGGAGFGRQWHPVLQRMRIDGRLKLHRVAEVGGTHVHCALKGEHLFPSQPWAQTLQLTHLPFPPPNPAQDYALPQVQCALKVDPIAVSLNPAVVQLLLDALELPPTTAAPASAAAVPPAAPPEACAPGGSLPGTPVAADGADVAAAPPLSFASGAGSGGDGSMSASGAAAAPVIMLDLQLKSFDLRFSGASGGAGSAGAAATSGTGSVRSVSSGSAALAALEARLTCAGASVSVHSLLDGLAVQARCWMGCPCCHYAVPVAEAAPCLSLPRWLLRTSFHDSLPPPNSDLQATATRLLLQDLSPSPGQPPHLPPPVRGPLPRLVRHLGVDRLSVSHTGSFGTPAGGKEAAEGPNSLTTVELLDLTVEGFAGEVASFLGRWGFPCCGVRRAVVCLP